jgi:two-component system osmolarity sensor histidine kinase EnvZ
MSLLPKTLRARTILVVFAAVLIAQAITLVRFLDRDEFIASGAAGAVASYIRLLQAAMASMAPEKHTALLATLQGSTGMRILPDEAQFTTSMDRNPPGHGFVKFLQAELGSDTVVLKSTDASPLTFFVGFQAGGQKWWLVLDGPKSQLPERLMGLAAIVVVVLGLSAPFVLGMTRPLRSLTEATRAFESGRTTSVPLTGPREIRELAERFNQMLARIEANERERTVMLAGLPHDLRTPISRLKVRAELVEDSDAREGFRRDVQDIEHISQQFVQYLRGVDGPALERSPLNLVGLVGERVERWVKGDNDVRMTVASGNVVVNGNRVALERLTDNLIGNAIQHGAPPIEIEVARADAGRVQLVVRDHGRGIPESEQSTALEPFTQLSAARGTKGSVGLGLAIAARIVRAHGGELQFRKCGDACFEVCVTLDSNGAILNTECGSTFGHELL